MAEIIYCVDTSSMIHIHRDYPEDVFAGLWQSIAKLVQTDRLIAPREVFKEIERGDDQLLKWAKKHKHIFRNLDPTQVQMVKQIEADFPALVDWLRETPEADPFVIALAQVQAENRKGELFASKHIVVTQESPTKANRIPAVCRHYGIECINVLELFRREGWKF
ncbi:MAG: DUF4411 family protein [Verrucomicrobiia bacterium]